MKKIIVLIAVVVLGNTVYAQSIPKWKITDLENYIENCNRPVIINFWATFCQPCLKEIPYFISQVKKHEKDSIAFLLVSLDLEDYYPDKIKNYAASKKFNVPIVWLNETNADYFCPLVDESWSGAIPASLFINNKTGYRRFFEEEITEEKLEAEIVALIKL
ncbi:MAG TPA: TlpA disulfide reductase family protein [Chitinophagaceae bacterium]|jgi:Uncharacterized protein SCO1/SenC/PrrC, involved in biogenesis of respiratory and photosynthetic systems